MSGAPMFRDLGELLALGPSAVIVATPALSHRPIVERCLAARSHVLVEKPLATTVADARAMVHAAHRAQRLLVVGHVERYSPVGQKIREAMSSHSPVAIATARLGRRPTHVRDVGALLDLATHDVDLVRWWTGRDYVEVSVDVHATAYGGHETHATVQAVLDDGTRAIHEVSWLAEQPIRQAVLTAVDGRRHPFDLATSGGAALVAQDEAFLAACGGAPTGALAIAADGAAAVEIVSAGSTPEVARVRAGVAGSEGAAGVVARSAADGSCAARH